MAPLIIRIGNGVAVALLILPLGAAYGIGAVKLAFLLADWMAR